MNQVVLERDPSNRIRRVQFDSDKIKVAFSSEDGSPHQHSAEEQVADFLKHVFLPSGYPDSVSPDYTRYQILNALQAFCNSLASLISSRAILQGFGVGDAGATATHALLLTVMQDVCGRLTTICSAYFLGTSLYPEAKNYRLLADILNDIAVVLDTFSPAFNSIDVPGLRVGALCLSAAFKSLCSICAGGSKTAITLHFAHPIGRKGDVGDINAKDASKETVLALLGSLLGTLVVPRLNSPSATYSALFSLIALHIFINYHGVKGLALRTLNRQRLMINWISRRVDRNIPSPQEAAEYERIFLNKNLIIDPFAGTMLGECLLGSSISRSLRKPIPTDLFSAFEREKFLVWYEAHAVHNRYPRVHVYLKDGYTSHDLLKAWVHAIEICHRVVQSDNREKSLSPDVNLVKDALSFVDSRFPAFISELRAANWDVEESALMTGPPSAVITEFIQDQSDDRKRR